MKFLISIVLLASTLLIDTTSAEEVSASTFEISGTWKVDTTKNSLTDRRPIKREDTWVFKDGSLTIQHIPREGTYYDQLPEPYKIEGNLVTVTPMGSSKSETYTIIEKTENALTLKGRYGTYYFLSKK